MKIIFISNTIDFLGGGIANVTRNYSQQLNSQSNINLEVWVPYKHAATNIPGVTIKVFTLFQVLKTILAFIFKIETEVSRNFYSADFVHRHGIWSFISLLFIFLKNDNKYFSPHGLLMPSAFLGLKKRVIFFLFENKCLFHHIIACSDLEKESLVSLSRNNCQSIHVIPNAVSEIFFSIEHKERFFSDNGIVKLLYVGAFSSVKNLELLIKALGNSIQYLNGKRIQLDLYGYGNKKYVNTLKKLCLKEGLNEFVEFKSPVYEQNLVHIYDSYDYFISVSSSENYGITIAEALVRGTPVIVTSNLPWNIISENNLGQFVEPNINAVSDAIINAVNVDTRAYKVMSKNAISTGSLLKWKSVTEQLLRVYLQ